MGDEAEDDVVRRTQGIARMFYVGRHGRRADAPPPPGEQLYALVGEIIDPDEVLFFNWTPKSAGRAGEIVLVTAQALTHIVYREPYERRSATTAASSASPAYAGTGGADPSAWNGTSGPGGTGGPHGMPDPLPARHGEHGDAPAIDAPAIDSVGEPDGEPDESSRGSAADIAVHRLSRVRSLRWSARHYPSPLGNGHRHGIVIVGDDWEVVVSNSHTLGPAEQLPAFAHLSQILDLA